MPQFGFYPSQIFWLLVSFGILFVAMRFFLLPPIEAILKMREDKIKAILREADKLTAQSERLEKSYRQYVDLAAQNASKILQTAHDEIATENAQAQEDLLHSLQSETQRAQERVQKRKDDVFKHIGTISYNFMQTFLNVFYQIKLPEKGLKKKIADWVRREKNVE